MGYSDADVAGLDENALTLYVKDDTGWQDAACGPYQRFPDENWMLVPICRTVTCALLGPGYLVHLPSLHR